MFFLTIILLISEHLSGLMIKKSLIGFIPMILNGGTEFSETREHRTQEAGFWTLRSLKTGSLNPIPRPCGVLV